MTTNRRRVAALLGVLAMAGATASHAKIDLVTLPNRDTTQLTIYNSQDLTLVRERRTLPFNTGENQIQFSWANTLIDPTSLRIEFPGNSTLKLVDTVHPANTRDLVVWNINAPDKAAATVEITYFISGLSWTADYTVVASADMSTLTLTQSTTLRNQSGEDFRDAAARVVVGEVNLVDLIADLARRGVQVEEAKLGRAMLDAVAAPAPMMENAFFGALTASSAPARREAREIIKRAVSEYKLYTIDGNVDLENGWGQKLPEKPVADVPFTLSYEIDAEKHGDGVVKFFKWKNDTASKLGRDALPAGTFYVYAEDGRGALRFEGRADHKYIPVGDEVELNLGPDPMVQFEQRQMGFQRRGFDFSPTGDLQGWEEVHTVELEIRNSNPRAVPVKLTHYLDGDWTLLETSDKSHEVLDQRTIRWTPTVDAGATHTITLKTVHRQGTLARRTR